MGGHCPPSSVRFPDQGEILLEVVLLKTIVQDKAVLITTYDMVRSDIEILKFTFATYIQEIESPHRIILTGTRMQYTYERVLYVDLDIHHGDGVEEAFYTTNRVMTVSFYKYVTRFFPYTGSSHDIGEDIETGYSLNVPLDDELEDVGFRLLFEPVMRKVMEVYRPEAIVLRCGADSLYGDVLANFNLTIKGHANCLKFLRTFNVSLMVLGGGGYFVENVAKCWSYETSITVDVDIDADLALSHHREETYVNKNDERDLENLRFSE